MSGSGRSASSNRLHIDLPVGMASSPAGGRPGLPPRAVRLSLAISLALHAALLVHVGAPPVLTATIGSARPAVVVLSLTLVGPAEVARPSHQVLAALANAAPSMAVAVATSVASGFADKDPLPLLPGTKTSAAAAMTVQAETAADAPAAESQPGRSERVGPASHPLWHSSDSAALAARSGAALAAQAQSAQIEWTRRQAEPALRASYEAILRMRLAQNPDVGECTVDIDEKMAPTAACNKATDSALLQTLLDQIGAAPPVDGRWQIQIAGGLANPR